MPVFQNPSCEFCQGKVSQSFFGGISGEGQRWCLLILIMGSVINVGIKC